MVNKELSLTLISNVRTHRLELISLCVVFLLYTGIVPVCTGNAFSCLITGEDIVELTGTVASSPAKQSSGRYYSVKLKAAEAESAGFRASCSGLVMLYVPSEAVEAYYPGKLFSQAGDSGVFIEEGAVVRVKGKAAGTTGGLDFTLLRGNLEMPAFRVAEIEGLGWESWLQYLRAFLRLQLKRLLFAWGEAGGLLLALISGSREYTDTSVSEAFRNAGLSHILALSGMHLSLFAGLTDKSLGRAAGKRWAPWLSLVAASLFVWFAGVSPSLLRALICMYLGFIFRQAGFRATPVKVLALSFMLQLLISPADAGNAAFMLSYLALCGVYAGDRVLGPFLCRFMPPAVAGSAAASAGAQLFTLPVSLEMSGRIIPAAILASVAVSPVASIFVTGGIVAVSAVLLIPFLLEPVGCIMKIVYSILYGAVSFFSSL